MKKLLFAALFAATLFTAVSCASKQAAEDDVDAPSQAKLDAMETAVNRVAAKRAANNNFFIKILL